MTLAEMDEWIYSTAARIIAGGQQHSPMIFIIADGGSTIIDVGEVMTNDRGKDAVGALLAQIGSHPDVTMVAFVSEAWQVTLGKSRPSTAADLYAAGVTPSQHPERVECLVVTYSTKDGTRAQVSHLIHRTNVASPRLERGELQTETNEYTLEGRFFAPRPGAIH